MYVAIAKLVTLSEADKLILQALLIIIIMNICLVPHLESSPKRFKMATAERYSLLPSKPTALESHAALNEWLLRALDRL